MHSKWGFTNILCVQLSPGDTAGFSNVKQAALTIIQHICQTMHHCPRDIRELCRTVYQEVSVRFPGHELRAVAGFVFLRFFCPAIIDPVAYQLYTGDALSSEQRRALINITKLLQLLANQSAALAEPWMIENDVGRLVEESKDMINSLLLEFTVRARTHARIVVPTSAALYHRHSLTLDTRQHTQAPTESEPPGRGGSAKERREAIAKIYAIALANLKPLLNLLAESKTQGPVLDQIASVIGYPLEAQKSYSLKVADTDYYLPNGGFRPLLDSPLLCSCLELDCDLPYLCLVEKADTREVLLSRSLACCAFGASRSVLLIRLLSNAFRVAQDKTRALQVSCLVSSNYLSSWQFHKPEINLFRAVVLRYVPSCKTTRCHVLQLLIRLSTTSSLPVVEGPTPLATRTTNAPLPSYMPSTFLVIIALPQDLFPVMSSKTLEIAATSSLSSIMELVCSRQATRADPAQVPRSIARTLLVLPMCLRDSHSSSFTMLSPSYCSRSIGCRSIHYRWM